MKKPYIIPICMTVFFAVICVIYLSGAISSGGADIGAIAVTSGDLREEIDLDFLRSLEGESFNTVIRSSGQRPRDVMYTGVPLSLILDVLEIDWQDKRHVIVSGADSYAIAVLVREILEPDNVYIVYALDGRQLKPASEGGEGPFQLIIRKDTFAQRWCKYINLVEIQ